MYKKSPVSVMENRTLFCYHCLKERRVNALEIHVRRLCACGYPEGIARQICMEFARELGFDMLAEYVADVEAGRARRYVA